MKGAPSKDFIILIILPVEFNVLKIIYKYTQYYQS